MTSAAVTDRAGETTTYASVFGNREFAALWLAQLASIAGDQFARIALAVLVYNRTRSALLAAVIFAATILPLTIGGLTLGWLADRYPRRTVMVACDLICVPLVLAMAVPGVPVAVLVVLLAVVSLTAPVFMAARSAVNRDVLGPDRFRLGVAITMTTYQVGQLAGLGIGGVAVAVAGVRGALLTDAGTFAVSALLVAAGVRHRPVRRRPVTGSGSGIAIVFRNRAVRTAMLLSWLAAFYVVPEGVVAPLSRSFGGGAAYIGLLLAAACAGTTAGLVLYGRLVSVTWQRRAMAPLAGVACAVLIPFALLPPLAGAVALLAASGLFTCYLITANSVTAEETPDEHRGKVFGVTGSGMYLGQGLAIVAAGAAAGHIAPAYVIAVSGAAGTALAVILAVIWRRLLPSISA